MDKQTESALRDYFEQQGLPQSKIDWAIGLLKVWQRKTVGLIAQEIFKLFEIGEANGTKENDNPKWFATAVKVKAFFDNLSIVKADFSLSYSEKHTRKDGVMVEIDKGGHLLEQGQLFADGAGADFGTASGGSDDDPDDDDGDGKIEDFPSKASASVEEPVGDQDGKTEPPPRPAKKATRKRAAKKAAKKD